MLHETTIAGRQAIPLTFERTQTMQVFKIMAYMGIQYQTMYIKAYSVGHAMSAAIARGAVYANPVKECGQHTPFDFVA
jgi:hypothetical protein